MWTEWYETDPSRSKGIVLTHLTGSLLSQTSTYLVHNHACAMCMPLVEEGCRTGGGGRSDAGGRGGIEPSAPNRTVEITGWRIGSRRGDDEQRALRWCGGAVVSSSYVRACLRACVHLVCISRPDLPCRGMNDFGLASGVGSCSCSCSCSCSSYRCAAYVVRFVGSRESLNRVRRRRTRRPRSVPQPASASASVAVASVLLRFSVACFAETQRRNVVRTRGCWLDLE
jgi:hypothetical protein